MSAPRENESRTQARAQSSKRRVLVIDDDDVARQRVCDELQRCGYDVHDLPSPIGATRALVDQQIDVVLIDVVMPSISGDRLAKLFSGNAKLKQLGIVLMSGDGTVKLQKLAIQAGAHAVVDKGKLVQMLRPAVEAALHAHSRAGSGTLG